MSRAHLTPIGRDVVRGPGDVPHGPRAIARVGRLRRRRRPAAQPRVRHLRRVLHRRGRHEGTRSARAMLRDDGRDRAVGAGGGARAGAQGRARGHRGAEHGEGIRARRGAQAFGSGEGRR